MLFRKTNILILSASVLGLAACSPQGPNEWIPRGYTHQDNTPISSPKPTSPWLEEAVATDTENMAANTAAWQGAVFELIDGIAAALPQDGSPINVAALAPVTNQDLALDHYTRQALLQKKMTLTTTDGIGLKLSINSEPLSNSAALEQAKTAPGFQYVQGMKLNGLYLLTASLTKATGEVAAQSKVVGAFPHEKLEYSRLPGFSTAPVSGLAAPKPSHLNN